MKALLLALTALSVVALVLGLWVGAGDLSDPRLRETYLTLRAHRVAVAFFTGSALAVGGVLVQGLFRNPLASPSVLGTTAGASLGGQASLLIWDGVLAGTAPTLLGVALVPDMLVPLGCVAGALGSLVLLLAVTRGRADLVLLLLTGFLLSAMFLSLGGFLISIAQDSWELGRAVIAFTLGGVSGSGARQVALIATITIGGVFAAFMWARPLDLLLSGEHEAASLGVDVPATRRWCVVWTALLSGGAVAVAGNVGFVGLVVPHALRLFTGPDHRKLVPACAIGGGAFLVLCDVVARAIPTTGELPLGVVTGLIGAPLFLALLLRSRRELISG
ncbi:MAG: iron complex transport system permease protein [Myxococcota bacterium]